MRTVLNWFFRVVAVLALLLVIALAAVYIGSRRALSQHVATPTITALDLRRADLARGAHLVKSMAGCEDCHGADLGGRVFVNDPALGTIYAPNLTGGTGGFFASYTDLDFIRAVRYGIAPDGRPPGHG